MRNKTIEETSALWKIAIIFILIICVDILAIKDIMNNPMNSIQKILFITIVLFIPIIGISIYYLASKKQR